MPPKAKSVNVHALMAKAQFKYGRRPLPPPPELRASRDDLDTRNVVLKAIQIPKVADVPVHVADPRNKDPLDLDWDANRDAALKTMQE